MRLRSSVMFFQSRKYFGIRPARFVLLARVVRHGQARDLDDAALDGVDEAEVADEPGERAALGVAAVSQIERRGGRSMQASMPGLDARHRPCREAGVVDPVEPGQPDTASSSSSFRRFCSSFVRSSQRLLGLPGRVRPPAVVALVVQHQDRQPRRQVAERSFVKASAVSSPFGRPGSWRRPPRARSWARSACQLVISIFPVPSDRDTWRARDRSSRTSSTGARAGAPAGAP